MVVSKKLKPVEEEVGKSFVEMHKLGEYWGSMSQHVQFLRSEVGNKVFKDALKVASKKGYKQALRFIYNAVPKEVALEMDAVYLAGKHGMNRKKLYAKGLSAYKRTKSYAKAVAAMKNLVVKSPLRRKKPSSPERKEYAINLDRLATDFISSANGTSSTKIGNQKIFDDTMKKIELALTDPKLSKQERTKQISEYFSKMLNAGILPAILAIREFNRFYRERNNKPLERNNREVLIGKLNELQNSLNNALVSHAQPVDQKYGEKMFTMLDALLGVKKYINSPNVFEQAKAIRFVLASVYSSREYFKHSSVKDMNVKRLEDNLNEVKKISDKIYNQLPSYVNTVKEILDGKLTQREKERLGLYVTTGQYSSSDLNIFKKVALYMGAIPTKKPDQEYWSKYRQRIGKACPSFNAMYDEQVESFQKFMKGVYAPVKSEIEAAKRELTS